MLTETGISLLQTLLIDLLSCVVILCFFKITFGAGIRKFFLCCYFFVPILNSSYLLSAFFFLLPFVGFTVLSSE